MDRQPSRRVPSSTSSVLLSRDSSYFLPRIVQMANCGSNKVFHAGLALNQSQKTPTYDMQIKWVGSSAEAKEINDRLFSCQEKAVGVVECDGFCGRRVKADKVVQFGVCDHNVCRDCLATAPQCVPMYDGTPGCCNKDCLSDHVRYGSSASQKSNSAPSLGSHSSTSTTLIHCIELRVMHFFLEEEDVKKEVMGLEMKSDASLSQLKKRLKRYLPLLSKSTIFYTAKEAVRRRELLPLPKASLSLETLCDGKEHMFIIVAGPGLTIFGA